MESAFLGQTICAVDNLGVVLKVLCHAESPLGNCGDMNYTNFLSDCNGESPSKHAEKLYYRHASAI
jgi:hypothetical protein